MYDMLKTLHKFLISFWLTNGCSRQVASKFDIITVYFYEKARFYLFGTYFPIFRWLKIKRKMQQVFS